jgi:hypothetical protein
MGHPHFIFCLKIKEAGGKLGDCKERGEWAELYFMMLAAGQGMKVLRLFGQTGRYDVGVENGGRLLRVQVKSTIYKRRGDCYSLNVMGPQRQKYDPGTVDYFAILLIPIDDWYILPFEGDGKDEFVDPLHTEEQEAEVWRVSRSVAFVAGHGVDDSGLCG